MNIIKDGVRGALTKLVRTIVYIFLLLAIFYIIGLLTSKKASALTYKGNLWEPDMSNKDTSYVFGADNASHWFDFWFAQNYTNNTDYDLMGFRLNRNVGVVQDWSDYNDHISDYYTLQGILWKTDGTGIPCYNSGDYLDTFFCPISKNETYNHFTIMANVFNPVANLNLDLQLSLEQNRFFYNYDSTDIITAINNNGTMQIVNQQSITNQIISEQNSYIQSNSTTQAESDTQNAITDLTDDFTSAFTSGLGNYSKLTEAIFSPINIALTSLEDTCTPMHWDIPFVNVSTDVPCMSTIYNGFFRTFMTVFISIITGMYAYRTILKLFAGVKSTLDAEDDKIEVVDL